MYELNYEVYRHYHFVASPSHKRCVIMWKMLAGNIIHRDKLWVTVWHPLIRREETREPIKALRSSLRFYQMWGILEAFGSNVTLHHTGTANGAIMSETISLDQSFCGVRLIRDTGSRCHGRQGEAWKELEKYRQPGLWRKAQRDYHEKRISP